MLQVVHILQLLKLVPLSSTKPKTPSTPTVTEQPIRAGRSRPFAFLPWKPLPGRAHPVLWNETALELRYEHRGVGLVFFSDVLQALQATVFWEQGSVSEEVRDLGKITRSSYGGGLRLVGGSGNTYRFEISTGEEGAEMIVMFQYPWRREM